jgi:hypothetical protein
MVPVKTVSPAAPRAPARADVPIVAAPQVPRAPFEIIHLGIILHKSPGEYAIHGDVARVGDRLIARFSIIGSDGTMLLGFRPWEPEEDVSKTSLTAVDWAARLRYAMGRSPSGFHALLPSKEALDMARFKNEYPTIYPAIEKQLGAAANGPPRVFDPGAIQYPKSTEGVSFGQEWWRSWVEMHATGNFGGYGKFDGTALTESVLWTIDEQPLSVQNAAAIARARAGRSGAVQSRFGPLDQPTQDFWARPIASDRAGIQYGPRTTKYVDILTVFLRGGAQSVCSVVGFDANQAPF